MTRAKNSELQSLNFSKFNRNNNRDLIVWMCDASPFLPYLELRQTSSVGFVASLPEFSLSLSPPEGRQPHLQILQ